MANEVYANGREVSCKAADGKSICAFPDVCLSPPSPPAGPIPIPYPNTGMASDATEGSKTVKISGQEVMLKNKSYFKTSTGDEAATRALGMGVVTHQITGKVFFTSWSMDVKIESENVVRHLDLTTHNHMCTPSPPNTGPWLYGDKQAFEPGGGCETEGREVKNNCTSPPEDCYEEKCCNARKCMMVPFTPNKCCPKDDPNTPQKTPHHPIPFQDHYPVGSRSLPRDEREPIPGAGDYDGDKAPCICLEGKDHNVEEAPGRQMQHGRAGRAFAHYRDNVLTDDYKYENVNKKTAEIIAAVAGCKAACIQAQMDEYHIQRTDATGELRKSQQARKRGDDYYKEANEITALADD